MGEISWVAFCVESIESTGLLLLVIVLGGWHSLGMIQCWRDMLPVCDWSCWHWVCVILLGEVCHCGNKLAQVLGEISFGYRGGSSQLDLRIAAPQDQHQGMLDWGFRRGSELTEIYVLGNWITSPISFGPVRSSPRAKKLWNQEAKKHRACNAMAMACLKRVSSRLEENLQSIGPVLSTNPSLQNSFVSSATKGRAVEYSGIIDNLSSSKRPKR